MRAPIIASVVVLACGGGTPIGEMIDAPIIDSAPIFDGPPVDAAPTGIVSVTVTVGGAPGSGVTVYFQSDDSTLISETTTNASGVAATTMAADGFVTVVAPPEPAAGAVQVTGQVVDTFAGVQIGDALHVDLAGSASPTTLSLQLMAPADPAGSAVAYDLYANCGNGSVSAFASPTNVDVALTGCRGSGDLILESFTATNTPLDWLQATDVALGSGSATVAMTGPYTPVAPDVVSGSDIPADVASVRVTEQLSTVRGPLFEQTETLENGSSTGSVVVPTPGSGAALTAAFFYDLSPVNADAVDDQELAVWGALPTAPVALDIGASQLKPWTTAPVVSALLEQVSWSLGSAGVAPDYVIASVQAERGSGAAASTWTWNIAAGANEDGAIVYPTLPADLFDFNFRETDALTIATLAGVQSAGGYNAARPTVFDAIPGAVLGAAAFATAGTTGTAAVQVVVAGDKPARRSRRAMSSTPHRRPASR